MKMDRLSIVVVLLFFACSKTTRDDITLTVLDRQLVCIENFSAYDILQNKKIFKLYDSLSTNIIHYKITNNSENTYFFTINPNDVGAQQEDIVLRGFAERGIIPKDGISLNLYKDNSILTGGTLLTADAAAEYDTERLEHGIRDEDRHYLESARKRKLFGHIKPSLYSKEIFENSFVLHPRETKYFTSLVNLPYRENANFWLTDVKSQKPNFAALTLVNTIKWKKDYLSADQLKDIAENNYKIYDGTLTSNKVPVKLVSMP